MNRTQHSVLVAVCGTSPAVITETVQALYERFPCCVIDEVYVLTTLTGRARLVRELLESRVWETLKRELGAAPGTLRFGDCSDSIRILSSLDRTRNLTDICTPEDHLAMADQMCQMLRALADNPSVTIYASLAGGRKTMSTMLGLCFSLFARDEDKLFHVLVNEPFDKQLEPPFLFKPATAVQCRLADGSAVSTADARIDLIEIPCVKLRKLFPVYLSQAPGTYSELVKQANAAVVQQSNQTLSFDLAQAECLIGETCIFNGRKAPLRFLVYLGFAAATVRGIELKNMREASDYIEEVAGKLVQEMNVARELKADFTFSPLSVSKCLSELKTCLGERYSLYFVRKAENGVRILGIQPELIVLDKYGTLQKK